MDRIYLKMKQNSCLLPNKGVCLILVTGLIAVEALLAQFFICNGWNKAENEATTLAVIDSWGGLTGAINFFL